MQEKMKIKEATHFIKQFLSNEPSVGLILGSGLGVLADEIDNPIKIPYEQIPYFPQSTVEGHVGQLVVGTLKGTTVMVMQGRFHYYEGYSMKEVTFPIRVMKGLGISKLIVTNAAGGINLSLEAGDLMVITDHINHMNDNPLIGPNDPDLGVRFPDMSESYSKELRQTVKKVAETLNIQLKEGVYVANSGPTYETPAEVKMLRKLGGDAVGMSTVPEVIVARHSGIQVLGVSCISNMAAGILDQPLSHEEVMESTEKVKVNFINLVKETVKELS